jgi:hypothetical protein
MKDESKHTRVVRDGPESAKRAEDALDLGDEECAAARDAVRDDKCATDWAVFGFVPKTNKLKLVGQGEGGWEEAVEEFLPSKVQFGLVSYARGPDRKLVYVNWVGESVPSVTTAGVHWHEAKINDWMGYYSVQLEARCDEDLEEDNLKAKLDRACAAGYNTSKKVI